MASFLIHGCSYKFYNSWLKPLRGKVFIPIAWQGFYSHSLKVVQCNKVAKVYFIEGKTFVYLWCQ